MKTQIDEKLREGLKEIPQYPYNELIHPRYFSTILNPPEIDGLFIVHPNYDPICFEEIEKFLIKKVREFKSKNKPLFMAFSHDQGTVDSFLKEFPRFKRYFKEFIQVEEFETKKNVKIVTKTIGKKPKDIVLGFGGFYATACQDAHLVPMCAMSYSLYPNEDVKYCLEERLSKKVKPIGTGILLNEMTYSCPDFGETYVNSNGLNMDIRIELIKEEYDSLLKIAERHRINHGINHLQRIYSYLAKNSENEFLKFCFLLESTGYLDHEVSIIYDRIKFNSLRTKTFEDIGWYRRALAYAKHSEDKSRVGILAEKLGVSESYSPENSEKADIRLATEDLIRLGEYKKALFYAKRFGAYDLAHDLCEKLTEEKFKVKK